MRIGVYDSSQVGAQTLPHSFPDRESHPHQRDPASEKSPEEVETEAPGSIILRSVVQASRETAFGEGLARLVAFSLVVFVVAVFGIYITRQSGRIASIWLVNAVQLAMLVRNPRMNRRAVMGSGLAANLLADLLIGDRFIIALSLSLSNTLEVAAANSLLLRLGIHDGEKLIRWPGLPRFSSLAESWPRPCRQPLRPSHWACSVTPPKQICGRLGMPPMRWSAHPGSPSCARPSFPSCVGCLPGPKCWKRSLFWRSWRSQPVRHLG